MQSLNSWNILEGERIWMLPSTKLGICSRPEDEETKHMCWFLSRMVTFRVSWHGMARLIKILSSVAAILSVIFEGLTSVTVGNLYGSIFLILRGKVESSWVADFRVPNQPQLLCLSSLFLELTENIAGFGQNAAGIYPVRRHFQCKWKHSLHVICGSLIEFVQSLVFDDHRVLSLDWTQINLQIDLLPPHWRHSLVGRVLRRQRNPV